MTVNEFWNGINLQENQKKAVLKKEFNQFECERLYELYKEDHNKFFEAVIEKEDSELWFLWLYSHMACNVYELYQEADLSDEIFWNTFMDISLWCENAEKEFGVLGIREYEWFYRHIDMILFRFGRLQFESMGEEINIHIPQGCPLIWEDCEKSIEIAKKYFGDNKKFVCHSWLLYPGLDDVIDKNSNIGKFRSHFKVLKTDFNEREAEWRVFGKVLKNVSDYPEETSLQKRIKQYLLNGKTLGNGWAVLK